MVCVCGGGGGGANTSLWGRMHPSILCNDSADRTSVGIIFLLAKHIVWEIYSHSMHPSSTTSLSHSPYFTKALCGGGGGG